MHRTRLQHESQQVRDFIDGSCDEFAEYFVSSLKSLIGGGLTSTNTEEIYRANVLYTRMLIHRLIISPQLYYEFFKRNIPLFALQFPTQATGLSSVLNIKRAYTKPSELKQFEVDSEKLLYLLNALNFTSPGTEGHPNQFEMFSSFRYGPIYPGSENLLLLDNYFNLAFFSMQKSFLDISKKLEQLKANDLDIDARHTPAFLVLPILDAALNCNQDTLLSYQNIINTLGAEKSCEELHLLQSALMGAIYKNDTTKGPNAQKELWRKLNGRVLSLPSVYMKELPIETFIRVFSSHFKTILGKILYSMPSQDLEFKRSGTATTLNDSQGSRVYQKRVTNENNYTVITDISATERLYLEVKDGHRKLEFKRNNEIIFTGTRQNTDGHWIINSEQTQEITRKGKTYLLLNGGNEFQIWQHDHEPDHSYTTDIYTTDTNPSKREANNSNLSSLSVELIWWLICTAKNRFNDQYEKRFTADEFTSNSRDGYKRNGLLNHLVNQEEQPRWLIDGLQEIVRFLSISVLPEDAAKEAAQRILKLEPFRNDFNNLETADLDCLYAQIEFAARYALFQIANELKIKPTTVDEYTKSDGKKQSDLHMTFELINQKELTLKGLISKVGLQHIKDHTYKILMQTAQNNIAMFNDLVTLALAPKEEGKTSNSPALTSRAKIQISFPSMQMLNIMNALIENNQWEIAKTFRRLFENKRMPAKLDLFSLNAAAKSGSFEAYNEILDENKKQAAENTSIAKSAMSPTSDTLLAAISSGNTDLVKHIFDSTSKLTSLNRSSLIPTGICLTEAASVSTKMLKIVSSYWIGFNPSYSPLLNQVCLTSAVASGNTELTQKLIDGTLNKHPQLHPNQDAVAAAALTGNLDYFKEILLIFTNWAPPASAEYSNPLLKNHAVLGDSFETLFESTIEQSIELDRKVILSACLSGSIDLVTWLTADHTKGEEGYPLGYDFNKLTHDNVSRCEAIKSGNTSLVDFLSISERTDDHVIAAARSGSYAMFLKIQELPSPNKLRSLIPVISSRSSTPTQQDSPAARALLKKTHKPPCPKTHTQDQEPVETSITSTCDSTSPPRAMSSDSHAVGIPPVLTVPEPSLSVESLIHNRTLNRAAIIAAIEGGNITIFEKVIESSDFGLDSSILEFASEKKVHSIVALLKTNQKLILSETDDYSQDIKYECNFLQSNNNKLTQPQAINLHKMLKCSIQHHSEVKSYAPLVQMLTANLKAIGAIPDEALTPANTSYLPSLEDGYGNVQCKQSFGASPTQIKRAMEAGVRQKINNTAKGSTQEPYTPVFKIP
jgi:hypothetical protein